MPLISGIASSLFTGCIVSMVVAIVGYFHEKNQLKHKLQSNIKSLYINMIALKDVTGDILGQIAKTTNLNDLSFKNITGLASLNIKFLNGMDLELYDGFWSRSKTAHTYIAFIEYKNKLYNLNNIATQINTSSLKYDLQMLSVVNRQMQGVLIDQQEIERTEILKNSINIRTAKLHEYEASLIIELDDLASRFYKSAVKKSKWNEVKLSLQNEAKDILSIRN